MKNDNIFKSIPESLKEELFEDIVVSKNVKIERIVSDGHSSPKEGWYDSELHEWVILLQGEAILSFSDDADKKLQVGDFFHIPAHLKHKVSYTSTSEKTIWLAIYY